MPAEPSPEADFGDRARGDAQRVRGHAGRRLFVAPAVEPTPPVWWGRHLAETRWLLELARLAADPALLSGRGVPHGDGRSVVLMPGLFAGDQTLGVLAAWLRRIGYRPSLCGFIANVDCADRALARVERRVEKLHRRHQRRVALVGHSRGGHYARALAAARPELISHAVSLGADLQTLLGISRPTEVAVAAIRRGLVLTGRAREPDCLSINCTCRFMRDYASPFPAEQVRFTSVYSREDGVVRWERAIVPDADCVEVTGSHVGLVFNRAVYRAIANALAAQETTAHAD
jgi:triacylglycerol lipase